MNHNGNIGRVLPDARRGERTLGRTFRFACFQQLARMLCTLFVLSMLPSCSSPWSNTSAPQPSVRLRRADPSYDQHAVQNVNVRVYVSPRYSAEVHSWRNQLETTLGDANQLLEPALHVRLVIQDVRTWKPTEGDADLHKPLTELAELDPAEGRVWVMGLVGSVPRAAISIHELGMANLMGKHIVMRGMNDAREFDALQQEFRDLGAKDRDAIYRGRKRHKMVAVLLHEFAHTLGVPHEVAQRMIMNPTYDKRVEGISGEVLGLMRISLDHRLGETPLSEQTLNQKVVQYIEGTSSTWVPSDRDELLARLRTKGPAEPPRKTDQRIAGLSDDDNATFAEVNNDLRNNRAEDAKRKAQALFVRYPNVYKVQELRCQIAMQIGGDPDSLLRACDATVALTNDMIQRAEKNEK